MNLLSVLMLTGGIGFLLYGMKTMTDALEKLSKKRLKEVLSKMCSTTTRGVLLGTVVTAVLQSSSAVTVMAVSFVDCGVLTLASAAGIILGANVGTTATSVIFALSQVNIDGILGTNTLIYFLATVGFMPLFFSKNSRLKNTAQIIMGFSILMIGMESMSSAMKPLAENPDIARIFVMFSNPFFGIAAGALITAVIQSSSASVGILQALSVTGAVTFSSAIPIVMGQNIGTCFTALIACIGAKKAARQTAFLNLYFNMAGTVFALVILYSADFIMDFSFMDKAALPEDIAMIHVLFNVMSTLLLMPLAKPVSNFVQNAPGIRRRLKS